MSINTNISNAPGFRKALRLQIADSGQGETIARSTLDKKQLNNLIDQAREKWPQKDLEFRLIERQDGRAYLEILRQNANTYSKDKFTYKPENTKLQLRDDRRQKAFSLLVEKGLINQAAIQSIDRGDQAAVLKELGQSVERGKIAAQLLKAARADSPQKSPAADHIDDDYDIDDISEAERLATQRHDLVDDAAKLCQSGWSRALKGIAGSRAEALCRMLYVGNRHEEALSANVGNEVFYFDPEKIRAAVYEPTPLSDNIESAISEAFQNPKYEPSDAKKYQKKFDFEKIRLGAEKIISDVRKDTTTESQIGNTNSPGNYLETILQKHFEEELTRLQNAAHNLGQESGAETGAVLTHFAFAELMTRLMATECLAVVAGKCDTHDNLIKLHQDLSVQIIKYINSFPDCNRIASDLTDHLNQCREKASAGAEKISPPALLSSAAAKAVEKANESKVKEMIEAGERVQQLEASLVKRKIDPYNVHARSPKPREAMLQELRATNRDGIDAKASLSAALIRAQPAVFRKEGKLDKNVEISGVTFKSNILRLVTHRAIVPPREVAADNDWQSFCDIIEMCNYIPSDGRNLDVHEPDRKLGYHNKAIQHVGKYLGFSSDAARMRSDEEVAKGVVNQAYDPVAVINTIKSWRENWDKEFIDLKDLAPGSVESSNVISLESRTEQPNKLGRAAQIAKFRRDMAELLEIEYSMAYSPLTANVQELLRIHGSLIEEIVLPEKIGGSMDRLRDYINNSAEKVNRMALNLLSAPTTLADVVLINDEIRSKYIEEREKFSELRKKAVKLEIKEIQTSIIDVGLRVAEFPRIPSDAATAVKDLGNADKVVRDGAVRFLLECFRQENPAESKDNLMRQVAEQLKSLDLSGKLTAVPTSLRTLIALAGGGDFAEKSLHKSLVQSFQLLKVPLDSTENILASNRFTEYKELEAHLLANNLSMSNDKVCIYPLMAKRDSYVPSSPSELIGQFSVAAEAHFDSGKTQLFASLFLVNENHWVSVCASKVDGKVQYAVADTNHASKQSWFRDAEKALKDKKLDLVWASDSLQDERDLPNACGTLQCMYLKSLLDAKPGSASGVNAKEWFKSTAGLSRERDTARWQINVERALALHDMTAAGLKSSVDALEKQVSSTKNLARFIDNLVTSDESDEFDTADFQQKFHRMQIALSQTRNVLGDLNILSDGAVIDGASDLNFYNCRAQVALVGLMSSPDNKAELLDEVAAIRTLVKDFKQQDQITVEQISSAFEVSGRIKFLKSDAVKAIVDSTTVLTGILKRKNTDELVAFIEIQPAVSAAEWQEQLKQNPQKADIVSNIALAEFELGSEFLRSKVETDQLDGRVRLGRALGLYKVLSEQSEWRDLVKIDKDKKSILNLNKLLEIASS